MKHVRMPKIFHWIFAGCGVFFAAIAGFIAVEASLEEAFLMGLCALGCLVELAALRRCELKYDDEIVYCRRLIGWREVRIDEIDRVKRGQSATIYYAGHKRIRYDDWADDEGDLVGIIDRSCRERGQKLTVLRNGFSEFAERLYMEKLTKPGEFLITQLGVLAIPLFLLAILAVMNWKALSEPSVWILYGVFELVVIALDGLILYAIRHSEQHPRLARLCVKDWMWRQYPQTKKQRKRRS